MNAKAASSGGLRDGQHAASVTSHGESTTQLGASQSEVRVYAQGRVVGEVRAGVFRKSVVASKHMLRTPKAWALDCQSLADAEQHGAHLVAIHDADSGRTYTATCEAIRRDGFTLDRGFGRQIALPLDRWQLTGGAMVAVQMSLFGAAA